MDSLKNLKPVEIEIIIDPLNKDTILLNELLIFPHQMDGLHIWEAGIVLARYIYHNKELFADKKILELGTGVGVAGITALKYTACAQLLISDYKVEILKNAERNVNKNKLDNSKRVKSILLDWKDYKKLNEKFDVIIGSDLIYAGAPINDLASLINKSLNIGGYAYILIPTQRPVGPEFLKSIKETGNFELESEILEDEKFLVSPILDEKEGFRHFAGLKELGFFVHKLKKNR